MTTDTASSALATEDMVPCDEASAERLVCANCGDDERVSYNGSHELFPDARMISCDHEWDGSVCRRCGDRLVCVHCGDDDRVPHEAMHMPGT